MPQDGQQQAAMGWNPQVMMMGSSPPHPPPPGPDSPGVADDESTVPLRSQSTAFRLYR